MWESAGWTAWRAASGVCLLAVSVVACGNVVVEHRTSAAGSGGQAADSAGNAGAAASTAGGGSSGSGGASPGEPASFRRLTKVEYTTTVGDVLGTTFEPRLNDVATEIEGFDNNAAANGVSEDLYLSYLTTAEALAYEVFGTPALRERYVVCDAADDASCVRDVITRAGVRIFRRPLLQGELAAYEKAYTRARARALSHADSLREVLIALLASAQFVYRMELEPATPGAPISPYELATRLSYLLWSSAPDDTLLESAKQDALSSDAQLTTAWQRLLADDKSLRFTRDFAGQWLGARRARNLKSQDAHPQWNNGLSLAAADELEAFFDDVLQRDGDWRALLTSPVHFVEKTLAEQYNASAPDPNVAQRVELTGTDRRGLLGLVGVLGQDTKGFRSSPSARGAWISERLLCSPLPPTPLDMPAFTGQEWEIRASLELVGATESCQGCHARIDPLGLALERYRPLGQLRDEYANSSPAIFDVTLPASLLGTSVTTSGATGLSEAMLQSPVFAACLAQKLNSYAFGRSSKELDSARLQALTEQWLAGKGTLRELLSQLILSPAFRAGREGVSQ